MIAQVLPRTHLFHGSSLMSDQGSEQPQTDDLVLESLPDEVEASIRRRDAYLRELQSGSGGFEFLVSDVRRWMPGQRVRVAFLGGDTTLHRDIAEATKEITDSCNLVLDFGVDAGTAFRTWSTQDTAHAAEIRVSFDKKGFFSLVGTDSIAANIGDPGDSVGGRPHQCSLNLGGFDVQRPANWRGVVRHEFLHALSFEHEHQDMRGPCEASFRWDDDEGYERTTDARGQFVPDAAQRRPGIYTYLSGFPNFWNRAKVDHNLRTTEDPDAVAGPFDRASVMLYRFPQLFYRTMPSPCAPEGEGISLSAGDRRGLQLLYPGTAAEVEGIAGQKEAILDRVVRTAASPRGGFEGLETTAAPGPHARGVADVLRRTLAQR
jgi:hypothetical protein